MYGDGGFYFLQPVSADATYGGLDMFVPVKRMTNFSGGMNESEYFQSSRPGLEDSVRSAKPKPIRRQSLTIGVGGSKPKPKFQAPPKDKFTVPRIVVSPRASTTTTTTQQQQTTTPAYVNDGYTAQGTPGYMTDQLPASGGGDAPYFTTYDEQTKVAASNTGAGADGSSGGAGEGGWMDWVKENKVAVGITAAALAAAGYMYYQKRQGR